MAVKINGDGAIDGITSFNGGGFNFRNILYNGWVNTSDEINQRIKTFSEVSNGDYWADRWQRVSSTTMTQKVEEGNYIPNKTYTLSGTNVTTTQITSPSSGTWDWGTVPSNASLVQLELGGTASSFEYRPKGLELFLCQRYFEKGGCRPNGVVFTNGDTRGYQGEFLVPKRITPTLTPSNVSIVIFGVGSLGQGTNMTTGITLSPMGSIGFSVNNISNITNIVGVCGNSTVIAWGSNGDFEWRAEAEL